ncbi:hypothetical protein A3E46_00695 [Candidatus Woesebacteria bacterium RIFCSPHIGHO2_12_FULL_46_16]|uniref:Uncharacterized protein n=1 Tax=Candidatus Woesebacteria bacterium RIFCSPHIGHO2_12_FULL_46_16 TaxID=1802513 RepID=A0A1F8AY95_9BACT|nr:MAG: hypothetical protein A3E46_00695 [Candidatus Woesebacteria bacterium RIFCSPHIGHO2_12_FULL_46_16]
MGKIKIRILLVLLLGLFVVGAFLLLRARSTPSLPTPTPSAGAKYKFLIPGTSSRGDVLKNLGQPLNDEASELLNFKSNNPNLPHQAVVPEDTVVFIREIITAKDKKTTEDITSQYGNAPYTLYGPASVNGFNLYVYPDKGIAYIGHVEESILLEIWYFQPTTIEDFQTRWAKGYSTTHRPIQ